MIKKVFLIILVFTAVVFLRAKTIGSSLETNVSDYVVIKNQKVFLYVADTFEKKTSGLMHVDRLSEDNGMVFLFKKSDNKNFWMKNMKIPLDILFIYKDKIVKIYKEVPVCENENCPFYSSQYKVDSVLELKTGFCKKYNVKTGDKIKYSQGVKIKQSSLIED